MLDPGRLIEDKCEFCGNSVGIRWYDPCCGKQEELYQKEKQEWNDEIKRTKKCYNQTFGAMPIDFM